MSGIRCWFGLHRWPKWGEAREAQLVRSVFGKSDVLVCEIQERTCPDCGKHVFRPLGS